MTIKEEMIRVSESIKQSTAKLEGTARALASHGRPEEAQALEAALKGLKESLGKLVKVH